MYRYEYFQMRMMKSEVFKFEAQPGCTLTPAIMQYYQYTYIM